MSSIYTPLFFACCAVFPLAHFTSSPPFPPPTSTLHSFLRLVLISFFFSFPSSFLSFFLSFLYSSLFLFIPISYFPVLLILNSRRWSQSLSFQRFNAPKLSISSVSAYLSPLSPFPSPPRHPLPDSHNSLFSHQLGCIYAEKTLVSLALH